MQKSFQTLKAKRLYLIIKKKVASGKLSYLLNFMNAWFNNAIKYPEDPNSKRIALYAYNFLRGLLHQNPVDSFEDIDLAWAKQHAEEQGANSDKAAAPQ